MTADPAPFDELATARRALADAEQETRRARILWMTATSRNILAARLRLDAAEAALRRARAALARADAPVPAPGEVSPETAAA